jgi:hypothetical protein
MMQINYSLLAMAVLAGVPVREEVLRRAAAIQDDLLFYHEHTYGAAESISDPLAENSQIQWGEKASYVWSAVKAANLLREEALGLLQDQLPRADAPSLAVFNTLDWTRSGLVRVFIDHEISSGPRVPHPRRAVPVLAQAMERRAEGTYWALWVRDVPSLGYKTPAWKEPDSPRARNSSAGSRDARKPVLSPGARYGTGRIRSLVDCESGRELVDQTAAWALGQRPMKPCRRTAKSNRTCSSVPRCGIEVKPGANGPIWKSLLVAADLDGAATNRGRGRDPSL